MKISRRLSRTNWRGGSAADSLSSWVRQPGDVMFANTSTDHTSGCSRGRRSESRNLQSSEGTCFQPRLGLLRRRAAHSGNGLSARLDSLNGLKETRKEFASATGSALSNNPLNSNALRFPASSLKVRKISGQIGKWFSRLNLELQFR